MKPRNIPHILLCLSASLTGLAAAHPGSHATTSTESAVTSGLHHFLTSPFHIGPVLIAVLLLALLLRGRAASRRRH